MAESRNAADENGCTTSHSVLYSPPGLLDEHMPLDREANLALAHAVLATPPEALEPRDWEQIVLQLTGHAQAVADDVRRHCQGLPRDSSMRPLTEIVLAEAGRRLSTQPKDTVACAKNRARLVRALYERLDRIEPGCRTASLEGPPL
ncbi:DUF6415 family natural product biosynthesis protein [Streptomyces sp. NPDC054765]